MTDTVVDAHLVVDRGAFRLDIRLRIDAGEVVALLGPNGAGKTTALRALAGLQPLTGGHISVAGRDVDRPDRRLWTPPERRPVGVVFQDYLLFPHLSALDNVAFGPRRRGVDRRAARRAAADWLARVGLTEHARAKPRHLSGGQAQRVALARALAVRPTLLLLDEPLAALDARTRLDTRAELHRHLAEHPGATLLVTHDPLDALVLADRLVIIEDGRIVQEGDAATVTAMPRTDYVARLVGLNLYRGTADGHTVRIDERFSLTVTDTLRGEAVVVFPPSAVALHPHRPDGSPRNTWPATVTGLQRHGDYLRVQLDGPIVVAADITPAAAAQLRLARGQQVWAAVKATETRAYPAVTAPPVTPRRGRGGQRGGTTARRSRTVNLGPLTSGGAMAARTVVVGYDGSAGARAAAAWALTEAAGAGAAVELVYALEMPTTAPAAAMVPGISVPPTAEAEQRVRAVLDKARAAAAASHPTVPVSTTVVHAAASPTLSDLSRRADLVVVGSHGHGGWVGLLLGSVSAAVAAHAHCPVVVVRGAAPPQPDGRPVVVGVDGSACGQLALDFAFDHAAARGVGLTALRAWQPPGPPWTDIEVDVDAVSADEAEAVAALVRQRQDRHPAVPVDVRVVTDHPAHALVAASEAAQLVVVGSRGRGGMAALLLGSVSRQVVQHAACPVAVVHGPAAAGAR